MDTHEPEVINDFYLTKKNNITNESFGSGGQLKDRKQIVYRNVVNNLDTSTKKYGIPLRRPDNSNESNYIFERQLQHERVFEYNLKERIWEFLSQKLENYSVVQLKGQVSKKRHTWSSEAGLPHFAKEPKKNYNLGSSASIKSRAEIPAYNKNDIRLEQLLKY